MNTVFFWYTLHIYLYLIIISLSPALFSEATLGAARLPDAWLRCGEDPGAFEPRGDEWRELWENYGKMMKVKGNDGTMIGHGEKIMGNSWDMIGQ